MTLSSSPVGFDDIAAQKRTPPVYRRRRGAIKHRHIGSYIAVAVVMIFFLFPLAFLLNTSLKSNAEFARNPMGLVIDPQWSNFPQAWSQGGFGTFILNSLLYTIGGAGIGVLITLVLGFPVARGYIRGARQMMIVFVLILFLPNALITQFQLLLHLHLYDSRLGYILIVAAGVGVGPLLFRGFVTSIPTELDEAAAIDGAGYWRFIFTFVAPLARPALTTVFLLQAVWIWNEIILATVLLPDQSKAPLTLGLFRFQGTYTNQWGLLSAATILVATPLIIAYVFLQRYIVAGVIGGAIKG
ncbi:MAG: carbohydrate ABC transporter permease [Propionibacteriaceae bacterium]|nr:carbohydrate ABC transporter permease [Propionibacteriaceae bacterium]